MMVPLTASLYVPGTVIDTNSILVDIGTGYYVEKNVADAQDLLERKIGLIQSNADSLQGIARQKQRNLEVTIPYYKCSMLKEFLNSLRRVLN